MNYGIIAYTLGYVLKIEGLCLLLPLLCTIYYNEPYKLAYILCIGLCLVVGSVLSLKKPKNKEMYAKEGFVTVALSWIVLSIFGALPFVCINNLIVAKSGMEFMAGFGFVDAFFETVSGFTTTGSSILSNVELLPKSLLFWRSFTHWIGGMGILVFLVAVVPLSGGSNVHLLRAESPGPSVNKLVPKVRSTAGILYTIYVALTILQIVLLLIGKMNFFDAVTITFGTAGTGGFVVTGTGIAGYSPFVQYVITIFMIIFGVDFSVYYLLFIRRSFKEVRSDEVRGYLAIIIVAIALIFINLRVNGVFKTVEETFRQGAFQVASIITTTGFAMYDYNKYWPEFSKVILVILTFIGACAGSTGGGMKVSRLMVLIKSIFKEVKTAAHPRSVHKITMNGRAVPHETVRGINVYIMSYLSIFALALLIISIDGKDFTTNFTAVATTINNVGPGLAEVGPMGNFSGFSVLSKIVLSFVMITGRLEIFPMLVLFSPYTTKK